jgi:hypothetical protein
MIEYKYIKGQGKSWQDLSVRKFNKLTPLGYVGGDMWHCRCDCGTEKLIRRNTLFRGLRGDKAGTKSCGCSNMRGSTHGMTGTREYMAWLNMKARCSDSNKNGFKNYKGRGISVCVEWANSFEAFLLDMGSCPDKMSLDRIDNDSGYNKANCRWADTKTQLDNRGVTYRVPWDNQVISLREYCKITGKDPVLIRSRVRVLGWSLERSLNERARDNKNRGINWWLRNFKDESIAL